MITDAEKTLPASVALFLILYQIRLVATDLVDTPVFIATLVIAFIAGWVLASAKVRAVPATISLLLVPWCCRLLIAMPRMFFPGTPALVLDSLLLNFDRNTFVSLLPFYWAGLATYFSACSRRALRAHIVAADVLLITLFCIFSPTRIELYRWPIVLIAVCIVIIFLQVISLIVSLPPAVRLRRPEGIGAAVAALAIIFVGGMLFLGAAQQQMLSSGGGLLSPNMFQFDFSKMLELEHEISQPGNDLELIVKKPADDSHILIRRSVLSGYSLTQGFFRYENLDEKNQVDQLPARKTVLNPAPRELYRLSEQEYFVVNFDPQAFIAMNEPTVVTPFEQWDSSSFIAAYTVQSHTSEALPFELFYALSNQWTAESFALPADEYAIYTEYGHNRRIRALAEELTDGIDNYWERIQVLFDYLKEGEYRYSLKPGIAPDGNQLEYFLFQSKKGYCSYYAFAFCLLLRSLGIPSRVAAGFFLDPTTESFDYYPVRASQAHAWVEVLFPDYGWIEYDPTSNRLAEGEEFSLSMGAVPDRFETLMQEILENHSKLRPREGDDEADTEARLNSPVQQAIRVMKRVWPLLLIAALALINIFIRAGYVIAAGLSRNPRKKARLLWLHIRRRTRLAGYRRSTQTLEPDWAYAMEAYCAGTLTLYHDYASARFAPVWTLAQYNTMLDHYREFSIAYQKKVPWVRRALAWIAPIFVMLPQTVTLLLLIMILAADTGYAQADPAQADELYNSAAISQNAELWERAIEQYSTGTRQFPEDPRFPLALGNLYFGRGLYRLAYDQYRHAERLVPDNPELLYRLSQTTGAFNDDASATTYLERLVRVDPDNITATGLLGWMYYKVHRLGDGEAFLLGALDRFGPNADFYMTLGTIYSSMFRYEDAATRYRDCIALVEATNDRLFTSIAHYNFSILESRFYHFDEAWKQTTASLAAQNRSSGHLAKGEMYLRTLNFSGVLSEYNTAYELDTSPLSKMSLAQSYQVAGQLEEARFFAEDCLHTIDTSWMMYYGLDPAGYQRDLHEILYKTYQGLAHTEERVLTRFINRFTGEIHQLLFRKYGLISAHAYKDGFSPDVLIEYYNVFDAYPGRALTYLRTAQDFEVPRIPQSAPSYLFEESRMLRRPQGLRAAIEQFDPVWERDMKAEALTELAIRSHSSTAAEDLYLLNRGALHQAGIPLPVNLAIAGTVPRLEQSIQKVLSAQGIQPVTAEACRFQMFIRIDERSTGFRVQCELFDTMQGVSLLREEIPLVDFSRTELRQFALLLSATVFQNR